MLDPVGFWSYARDDDIHSDGQLSQLRTIVGKAIGLQYGGAVTLWQDIAAIPFGADWAVTIDKTIEQTSFFIPIVTPRFLKSRYCFDEFMAFRQRMIELGRDDLIFPVQYVDVKNLRPEETVFGDDLATLRRSQWIDFVPHLYADPRSVEVRKWAGDLAASILQALRRPVPAKSAMPSSLATAAATVAEIPPKELVADPVEPALSSADESAKAPVDFLESSTIAPEPASAARMDLEPAPEAPRSEHIGDQPPALGEEGASAELRDERGSHVQPSRRRVIVGTLGLAGIATVAVAIMKSRESISPGGAAGPVSPHPTPPRESISRGGAAGSVSPRLTLTEHLGSVKSVAFSPDGRTLASGSEDKTIKLWDVADGHLQRTLTGHSGSVLSVAFSPDGRTLASGSGDSTIKFWDVVNGQLQRTLTELSYAVYSVIFSPDGRTFASGSVDSINLWDVETGQLKLTLRDNLFVYSVAFSPDGRTLASGGAGDAIKVWDVADSHLQRTLTGQPGRVYSVAFSPDGRTLASGSADNVIELWDLGKV